MQKSSDAGPKAAVMEKKADPWQNWQPKNKVTPAIVAPARARINEVTKEPQANVKGMIQTEIQAEEGAAPSGVNEALQKLNDQRLNKLEAGLQEIQVQQGKFQSWFQETGIQNPKQWKKSSKFRKTTTARNEPSP